MYATNLASVARAAGLTVSEVDGWQTRGHGGLDKVKTIVCHHTAGPHAGNAPSLNVVTNGRTGLSGPLSNFVLGRDGTVYVVAAGLCYHAGAVRDTSYANAFSLGIEAENTGLADDPWPEVQVDAYARLCAALVLEFDLTVGRVLGHKEVCYPPGRKIDPTLDMDNLRRRTETWIAKLRTPAHSPAPNVVPGFVLRRFLRAGNSGSDVAAWQKVVGARPDGDFGPLTEAATKRWQRAHRLDDDGVVGPASAKAAGWKWQPK